MSIVRFPHDQRREFQKQCHIFDVEDNWGVISDNGSRRRIQNRLNQRAFRSRKKRTRGESDPCNNGGDHLGKPEMETVRQMQVIHEATSNNALTYLHHVATTDAWYADRSTILVRFYELQLARYVTRTLSSRHLLSLLQVNVLQAFESMLHMIGVTPEQFMEDNTESVYTGTDARNSSNDVVPELPVSLLPSMLQKTIPHHPWVDILPFPQMRDNILLLKSREDIGTNTLEFDQDELCLSMIGMCPQQPEGGLVLWGEPWDPSSWELTAEFVHHWGWLLKDCQDLMRSTNYWRKKRGERPLFKDR